MQPPLRLIQIAEQNLFKHTSILGSILLRKNLLKILSQIAQQRGNYSGFESCKSLKMIKNLW